MTKILLSGATGNIGELKLEHRLKRVSLIAFAVDLPAPRSLILSGCARSREACLRYA